MINHASILFLVLGVFEVTAQPVITRQPSDQSVSLSGSANFSVSAMGVAPISFQWRFNGAEVSGWTNRTLVVTNVGLTDVGSYDVLVRDSSGGVVSRAALLEIDPTFVKISSGPIVTLTGNSVGCGWGDYNNDGYPDLYVARFSGQDNWLFLNQGDGSFADRSSLLTAIGGGGRISVGCAWGDFDNDGLLDLFVANSTQDFLFHNGPVGAFSRVTTGPVPTDSGDSGPASWIDYDNDGDLDLLVVNLNAAKFLYRNDGNGSFTRVTTGKIVTDPAAYGAAWADYDGDGYLDLFAVGPDAGLHNALYHNERDGTFTKITSSPIVEDSANSRSGAWGDYNNDGFFDLFVVNRGAMKNLLYQNNRDGTFRKVTSVAPVADAGEFQGCAWGDYDNDGYLDLFLAEHFTNNRLYRNNGDGTFTRIIMGSPVNDGGNSASCTWEDYDNDGFLDLFVANGANISSQRNFLYRNSGNSNGWIKVRCVGTVSNRSAIGTKVRVETLRDGAVHEQVRQIGGGDGVFSPTSLEAHFGLGSATNIHLLRVEWPSGLVQNFTNVLPRQILTVVEPPKLSVVTSSGQPQISLRGGQGFDYELQHSIDLSSWSTVQRLRLTNSNAQFPLQTNPGVGQSFYRAVSSLRTGILSR